jgi:hypothetical protein
MSIDAFLDTLTDEQKAALLKALTKNDAVETKTQQKEEDKNQFIAQTKKVQPNQRRKEPVRAKQNTWTDTGEDRDIETPKYEPTPRTREKVEKVSVMLVEKLLMLTQGLYMENITGATGALVGSNI